MGSVYSFGKAWYNDASGPLRSADPLLMGAAFAYNSLFALVPLALAFVSTLTLFDVTQEVLENLVVIIEEALPPDLAAFLIQILSESTAAVEDNRVIIIIVTVLVALWSGSRAVYTVQKALRLMEGDEADASYVRLRATGVLVTLGAGIAVIVGYTVMALGSRISAWVETVLPSIGGVLGATMLTAVAVAWVFFLLFAVYRWGGPRSLRRPAVTAVLVTAVLGLGTWVALNLVPAQAAASVAVFGTMGVVLLWLYGVGIVVVGGPILVESLLRVLDDGWQR